MGRKGAQTRQRLIDATVELLERRPLRDVSVSEITALAGTSSSSFYNYFEDVAAAALAAAANIEQYTPEMGAILEEPWVKANAREKAMALMEAYVAFASSHHAILRVRNLAADEGDRRFHEVRHDAVAKLHRLLEKRITAAGNGLDAGAGASAILSLMERIAAIARLPLRRNHSRKRLVGAAAFLIAASLAED
ncbi:MAG: TetR/AcrR family transcriptional regulator [Steroidobacteraceae bacterium]